VTRIAIVSPSILPADAIGRDVLHMGRCLAARGHEVGLFSTTWGKPEPRNDDGLHVRDYLADDPRAVLIMHHAIGWKHAVPLITGARCRRVVKYHNVTPAHFYEALDPHYADLCRQGRTQLRELIEAGCDLYLADSPFNRDELIATGADPRRCAVVPPFNDVARLRATEPDAEVLRDYGDGRTNLLFVGRRAPNKGHRLLLDAFAVYHHHFNQHSRLVLVGKGDPEQAAYSRALRQQVRRLDLVGDVVFLDVVSESELRGLYAVASAFVLASEHEGFCVPAVEAMALGVPVVGYGTTAVPGTVGEAGFLWDEPDPHIFAQSIHALLTEAPARRRLTERARRRYDSLFRNQLIERVFLRALRPLLTRRHPVSVSLKR
jgi:glycosyltransferase involved in cell wall biosynthesis